MTDETRPVPIGYGSLMNFTSIPQRVAGLLVEEGYIDSEDLSEIGLHTDEEHFYRDFWKVLDDEGALVDGVYHDDGEFEEAVDQLMLRAGLRNEVNQGQGGQIRRNEEDSFIEYLAENDLISKEERIEEYIAFFGKKALLDPSYDQNHEPMIYDRSLPDEVELASYNEAFSDVFSKLVTKAILDGERTEPELELEEVNRPKGKYVWDSMRDEMRITPVPVQIPGRRGYWIESNSFGGLMLGAIEGDWDMMTVMAYPGLEDEFYQELVADENKNSEIYDVMMAELAVPEELEEIIEEKIDPEDVSEQARYLLMDPENPRVNMDPEIEVNQAYHELIKESGELLAEEFGEEVGKWFVKRYQEETEGIPLEDEE